MPEPLLMPPEDVWTGIADKRAACALGAETQDGARPRHLPSHAVHAQGAGGRARLLQDGADAALQSAQDGEAAHGHHVPHRRQLQAAAPPAEPGDPGPGNGALRAIPRQHGVRLLGLLLDGGPQRKQKGHAGGALHRHEGVRLGRAVHVPADEAVQGARRAALRVGQPPALHRAGLRGFRRDGRRARGAGDLPEAGIGLLTERNPFC